jgi:hypothetical protein
MTSTEPKLGDILEAYCSRCQLNLDVSVAAVVDGKPVKVMCRTCGNEVRYRAPVDLMVKKRKQLDRLMRARQPEINPAAESNESEDASLASRIALRKLWDELTDKVDARYAQVYVATRTYGMEDALLHKKHGMGIVHEVHADGMINVLFREGFQQLETGQPPPDE